MTDKKQVCDSCWKSYPVKNLHPVTVSYPDIHHRLPGKKDTIRSKTYQWCEICFKMKKKLFI